MFSKLKKLMLGDKRPIRHSVNHPVLGLLHYSEDDEAWLIDKEESKLGFGLYIAGDWESESDEVGPSALLLDHAVDVFENLHEFNKMVEHFVNSQLKTVKHLSEHKDEISKLSLHRLALMWPERPDDGELEFRPSADSERIWGCSYIGKKPVSELSFIGLDV